MTKKWSQSGVGARQAIEIARKKERKRLGNYGLELKIFNFKHFTIKKISLKIDFSKNILKAMCVLKKLTNFSEKLFS